MKKNVNVQHSSPGKSNIAKHISSAELKNLYDEIEEEFGIKVGQWPTIKLWHIRLMQVAFVLSVAILVVLLFLNY